MVEKKRAPGNQFDEDPRWWREDIARNCPEPHECFPCARKEEKQEGRGNNLARVPSAHWSQGAVALRVGNHRALPLLRP